MALSIKTCSACGEALPISIFGKSPGYKDGSRGQCNPCRTSKESARLRGNPEKRRNSDQIRKNDIKQRYGLTLDAVEEMAARQDGKCAICGGRRKLVIDHCHTSGAVRGLLCNRCNVALGSMGDSLEGLKRAQSYLEAHDAYIEAKRRLHPGNML